MSAAPVRGWAASLILHGLFLAAVLAWVKPAPAPPLRWRVAVVPAAVDPDSPHLSPSPRRSGTPAPPAPLAPGQASAPAPDRTMATPDEARAPAPLAESAASRMISASSRNRFWRARSLLYGSTSAASSRFFDDCR